MTKLRVDFFSISLDGYGAGPNQSFDTPLGIGGEALHDWFVVTRSFHQIAGQDGGETGVDDDFAARGAENLGAFIMGRNMFGPPQGGDWIDDTWKGWWGDDPPYHGPVFVLTHYPRASITMEGGTTYHFVTDGMHAALKRATEAAHGKDIRLAGGVATIGIRREPQTRWQSSLRPRLLLPSEINAATRVAEVIRRKSNRRSRVQSVFR